MKNEYNISFIGSGNVATQLALALKKAGHNIQEIYSKSKENTTELAVKVSAKSIETITDLKHSVDFIIISINDDEISSVSKMISSTKATVLHTSGSVELEVLNNNLTSGVLYPLQTLSKDENTNFNQVPILIEGDSKETTLKIEQLAKSISSNVELNNSEQRKALHLAAVMSNNFTNHIFTLLREFSNENNINFDLLQPLINKTISKENEQTGPAKRNDLNTLNKHLEMLNNNPKTKDLYRSISNHILSYYGHKTEL